MSGHGNHIPVSYWMLKLALEQVSPKLVVVDTYNLAKVDKVGSVKQLHDAVDHFPLSKTKIEMVNDLLKTEEERGEFYWNF